MIFQPTFSILGSFLSIGGGTFGAIVQMASSVLRFCLGIIRLEDSVKPSDKYHNEEITNNSEELTQALKLPYRVVVNCAGDLGLGQIKKYDIETWLPSQERYRETHSSSMVHDFQTRRLKIRYKSQDGKIRFAHSLNNTAIATPRILQSLLENHQKEDGSVEIPEALRKYIGKDVIA